MARNPEDAEEHPLPTHDQAVQGQAPLQGGEAGTFKDNGYSVLCGGVPAVGGRGEGLWEGREGGWTVGGMLMTSRYCFLQLHLYCKSIAKPDIRCPSSLTDSDVLAMWGLY